MPFWPWKKGRRRVDSLIKGKEVPYEPLIESEKADLSRPPSPPPRKRGLISSPALGVATPDLPRRSSKRPPPLPLDEIEKLPEPLVDKENVPPSSAPPIISKEIVTALPMSYQLQYSPHLRPVDMERPHIPYNFRTQSGSQVNMPAEGTPTSPKANVLKKKRSSYEGSTPQRQRSSRTKKDEQLREEEIRAMSAQSPIPKRPGEGPLRRDSKKMRSGIQESTISLPTHQESMHESLPGILEQRGWEIGAMSLFNPRPAVRLSGIPQYVAPGSPRLATPTSPLPMSRDEKRPVSRDEQRKTIGSRADNLDSNDIRTLMERDAKRREQRKKEQQEKLDRKLRKREGRNRGDSDASRRRRKKAEEEGVPPIPAIHPAHRASPKTETELVGLGIAAEAAAVAGAPDTRAEEGYDVSPLEHPDDSKEIHDVSPLEPENDPFADPADDEPVRPSVDMPGSYAPSETQMDEDAVVETAQAVTMSQASTPPLSPVHSMRAASSLSRIAVDTRRASDIPTPTQVTEARRSSQPVPERRTGALASLFRRSAQPKKSFEHKSPPSEASFSNASRESMRGQPLPPHLVETQARIPAVPRTSGTPVRTQSKFREDLPEFPTPPDSRTASPDVTTAAAAAAAARRSPISTQYVDAQRQGSTTTSGSEAVTGNTRYDTPVSPSLRPGTSLASVDSEGAWLASSRGGSMKRQSRQSGLGARRADFSSSYEELGADTDAQPFNRSPETPRGKQRADSSALPAPSETTSEHDYFDAPEEPEEEPESPEMQIAETPTPTVHGTVHRRPTLVQRDSAARSREGLVTEFAAAGNAGGGNMPEPTSATTGRGSLEMDSDLEEPEPELYRATSVRVHQRNISTGSAKLLDVAARSDSKGQDSGPVSPMSSKMRL